MELIRGNIKAEWIYADEGFFGDYNPDDADDLPLLRFCISVRDDKEDCWEELQSRCTNFWRDADEALKMRALRFILGNVYQYINDEENFGELDAICDKLSHICDDNFDENWRV